MSGRYKNNLSIGYRIDNRGLFNGESRGIAVDHPAVFNFLEEVMIPDKSQVFM